MPEECFFLVRVIVIVTEKQLFKLKSTNIYSLSLFVERTLYIQNSHSPMLGRCPKNDLDDGMNPIRHETKHRREKKNISQRKRPIMCD